ncbi:Fpg/Nei family DNA glycosylase [Planctomicrobium sp. SH664]|uniref:Fpg/Nei family DNA glycosylase n=1 Tax=Planctomicrobium sp. SH664 TaxID=3448125 RepID=UPI003F5BBB2F
MPELPEITAYMEALAPRVVATQLLKVRIASPFVLRTFDPPLEGTFGQNVVELRRLGKRIAIGLENGLWLVIHLMIAGRLQWQPAGVGASRQGIARFEFGTGTLTLTEAGSRKRASLHVVTNSGLLSHDPGGIDVLTCGLEEFTQALTTTNRTVKRQLTNPLLFSGIGNAYSDEILHRARISPVRQTQELSTEEIARLHEAVRTVLVEGIDRLKKETGTGFPLKVTAFHPQMAVHGKFGEPCPVCGSLIQRIVYAENETNYCASWQNDGKVLADRSLSRLLKEDWPRRIEDWE